MIYPLAQPVPSNYKYNALRIENIRYDGTQYTADVFGVVNGESLPLIYASASGELHRVSEYTVSDDQINQVLAAHPEILPTDRMRAAMVFAVQQLYAAVNS